MRGDVDDAWEMYGRPRLADPLWKHARCTAMGLRALFAASYVPGPGAAL